MDASYITYTYDKLNRMTAVKNSSGTALASYTYDERSRRTALSYANGAGAQYNYDPASRLLWVDNQTGNGQHKYAYLYDNVGNRTSMMVTAGGVTRTHVYAYDNIYQVTGVDYPAGFEYLATDTTFGYDAAGNRTSVVDGSGTCTYTANNLNQYTAAGTVDFQYDANGNLTYDERFIYEYDPENRLVEVRKSGQGPAALSNATDTTLLFTTGGAAPWFGETGYAYYDNDAAQSGDLGDGQESWLQTTVEGAGWISFYWAVSSDGGDYLRFYIDDVLQNEIAGVSGFGNRWYALGEGGTHTFKWVYVKNGTGSYGSDCGWVDKVVWQPFPTPPDSLAEAVDSPLAFTTGGAINWGTCFDPSHYGLDAAHSGFGLAQGQESWLQTTVEGEGTFSFWAMISPAGVGNELKFYIDDTLYYSCGVSEWEQKSYELGTCTHTLQWVYRRPGSELCGGGLRGLRRVGWRSACPAAAVGAGPGGLEDPDVCV